MLLAVSGGSMRTGNVALSSVGDATIRQSGGFLTIGSLTMAPLNYSSSTLDVAGGVFSATGTLTLGGNDGTALVRMRDSGRINVNSTLFILANPNGSSQGRLSVETGGVLSAGYCLLGAGVVVQQSDGTASLSVFNLGSGESNLTAGYELAGGTLSLGGGFVGRQASLGEQSAHFATLHQEGGTFLSTGVVYLADKYLLDDGYAHTGKIDIKALKADYPDCCSSRPDC